MNILEIIFIALGLAMDAFAVAISNGICLKDINIRLALKFGIFFGGFQFLMPFLGYFFGKFFSSSIERFDHWIAFILLNLIGISMILETFKNEEEDQVKTDISIKNLCVLAIATSIDALAVGVSFAVIKVNILQACLVIGVVAFILSTTGVVLGKKIGSLFSKNAERFGGAILVFMGFKILIEHLFK